MCQTLAILNGCSTHHTHNTEPNWHATMGETQTLLHIHTPTYTEGNVECPPPLCIPYLYSRGCGVPLPPTLHPLPGRGVPPPLPLCIPCLYNSRGCGVPLPLSLCIPYLDIEWPPPTTASPTCIVGAVECPSPPHSASPTCIVGNMECPPPPLLHPLPV